MRVAADFIDGSLGRLLLVRHEPEGEMEHAVLVLPAFGDEMNKSRRLVWQTGQALAARGVLTLVPDLYGTGDSEGEFEDAGWEIWLDDLERVAEWAAERGVVRFSALGIRLGAMLLQDTTIRHPRLFESAVVWQAVTRGTDMLRQMLRMKIMALRLAGSAAPRLDDMLASVLQAQDPVELGGYLTSSRLARGIHRAVFNPGDTIGVERGLVVEIGPSPPPGTADSVAQGWCSCFVPGERFWSVVEPGRNDGLVAATTEFLAPV